MLPSKTGGGAFSPAPARPIWAQRRGGPPRAPLAMPSAAGRCAFSARLRSELARGEFHFGERL
eukprot:8870716-Pyramimonas_sp.AAC.1